MNSSKKIMWQQHKKSTAPNKNTNNIIITIIINIVIMKRINVTNNKFNANHLKTLFLVVAATFNKPTIQPSQLASKNQPVRYFILCCMLNVFFGKKKKKKYSFLSLQLQSSNSNKQMQLKERQSNSQSATKTIVILYKPLLQQMKNVSSLYSTQ